MYAPLLVMGLAVACLAFVLDLGTRRQRLTDEATQSFAVVRQGCERGDPESCGKLELLVKQPCLREREGAACLWLGYLNEKLIGVGWAEGVGLVRGDQAAAAHFGIACGRGIPAACRILRDHYEHPASRCPFTDKLNPLGPALGCAP